MLKKKEKGSALSDKIGNQLRAQPGYCRTHELPSVSCFRRCRRSAEPRRGRHFGSIKKNTPGRRQGAGGKNGFLVKVYKRKHTRADGGGRSAPACSALARVSRDNGTLWLAPTVENKKRVFTLCFCNAHVVFTVRVTTMQGGHCLCHCNTLLCLTFNGKKIG